jgi:hypothetical protein
MVALEDLKHDQTTWRFHRQTHHDGHSQQWVLESDEVRCMAIMELLHLSKWHKDRNPGWEEEWNADVERIQANADLIQSAPIMLEALLAAQQGDTSMIDRAIEHATGQRNWLGDLKEEQNV